MEQDKTAVSLLFCTGLKHGHVMKSGSLKLLEPSGPRRACYGTPYLPFYSDLKTVIVRFKLPDSRLQYFVHSSVSMNPSQGIYGGIGAGVIDRC
jgi:hypothetical protein